MTACPRFPQHRVSPLWYEYDPKSAMKAQFPAPYRRLLLAGLWSTKRSNDYPGLAHRYHGYVEPRECTASTFYTVVVLLVKTNTGCQYVSRGFVQQGTRKSMLSHGDHRLVKYDDSRVPAPWAALSIINLDAYYPARAGGHHPLSTTPVHFRPYRYQGLIYLGLRLSCILCPLQLHLLNLTLGQGINTITSKHVSLNPELEYDGCGIASAFCRRRKDHIWCIVLFRVVLPSGVPRWWTGRQPTFPGGNMGCG